MFIYTGGRRSGKTEKMVDWFLSDPKNRVIVTPNRVQAEHIRRKIRNKMGDQFPFLSHVISYYESHTLLQDSRNFEIGIENLDMILMQVFNSNSVEFVTTTGVQFQAPEVNNKPWWKIWSTSGDNSK